MNKTLTLGSIVLGCCLFALAQTSGSYQRPSGSSSSGYWQKKSHSYQGSSVAQFQSYPSSSADPAAMSSNQSAKQKTTVQGCLSQSAEGAFLLSDASGNTYQLNESSSRLAQFVGKEIRVDGFGLFYSTSGAVPGAMSAGTSGSLGPVQQIDVTGVRKIADRCQAHSGNK